MARLGLFLGLLLLVSACSAPSTHVTDEAEARRQLPAWTTESFPAGYEQWKQFTKSAIHHPDEQEVVELYYNAVAARETRGAFPDGSVLVKAQYRLENGRKGAIFQLSVMRKKGGTRQAGWTFATYDPIRFMQIKFDQDVCLVCHRQRADHDYTFSDFPWGK